MSTTATPTTLDVNDVAQRYNISPQTVRKLAREGGLPRPLELSDRIHRWLPAALDAWERSQSSNLQAH